MPRRKLELDQSYLKIFWWYTSRICVIASAFCNSRGCNHGKCKRFDDEILCAYDLVLMCKRMENLRQKFSKWKEAFDNKRLKVNLKKTSDR